ncbi:conserved hypothetical protein [Candidatus Zixiibacteriota bacterium]|nr:conserved hypothetical protein [candidate division Zixibacteria bacterium]
MILVREQFQVKFGKMKEALGLVKEMGKIMKAQGDEFGRICTDLTGSFYTLVFESTFSSMGDFDRREGNVSQNKEWKEWYAKFVPLIESGRREIFTIVE